MKTKLHLYVWAMLFAMTCLCMLTCSKKDNHEKSTGKLKLNVGISVSEVSSSMLKATPADFSVQILGAGNNPVMSFDRASDIPALLELPEGNYQVTASSGSNPGAAFESPIYQGTSEVFTISAEQTSEVTVTCTMSNIMVTVVYSDRVKNAYANYSTTVSKSNDSLVFIKTETRAGYFNAGPLHIRSNLYVAGSTSPSKVLTSDISNPQPGKHYEIQIDAKSVNGNAAINVNLDNSVVTEIVSVTDNGSSGGETPIKGDLLITEIMYNPLVLNDADGEWFELYNNSKKTLNIKGLVIKRGSIFHQINADVNMAAGAFAVMGKTSTATANVQYVYGSITLPNTGDELGIYTYGTNGVDGTEICAVNYGASGFLVNLDGKSLQLDPTIKDVVAAKSGSNWCASTLLFSTGDYGTPGMANSNCH